MKWNMEELQQRFQLTQGNLAIELCSIRQTKIPNDSSYEKFHDFGLGAQLVYLRLENTSELESPQRLIWKLGEMLKKGVPASAEAFSIEDVRKGWNSEIKKLLAEFSYRYESGCQNKLVVPCTTNHG